MIQAPFDDLFDEVRESVPPRVWSAGVELARSAQIAELKTADLDDRAFRIVIDRSGRSASVHLSIESRVWQCDCSEPDDPCRHVVAALVFARQRGTQIAPAGRGAPGVVEYHFSADGDWIAFERHIVWPERSMVLTSSLQAAIDALRGAAVAARREDFAVDHVLDPRHRSGRIGPNDLARLLKVLGADTPIFFEGDRASISPNAVSLEAVIQDRSDGGFRLFRRMSRIGGRFFQNGAVLFPSPLELAAVDDRELSADQTALLAGTDFRFDERHRLVQEILPALDRRISVIRETQRLPRLVRVPVVCQVDLISDQSGQHYTALPTLTYGDPPIARVVGGRMEYLTDDKAPQRDPVAERRVADEAMRRLGLRLGQGLRLSGSEAIEFMSRAKVTPDVKIAPRAELVAKRLIPTLEIGSDGSPQLFFQSAEGESFVDRDVQTAFRRGDRFLRNDLGVWAEVPSEWMNDHLDRARAILDNADRGTTPYQILALADLCDDAGISCPAPIAQLRRAITDLTGLNAVELPAGFIGQLRDYQIFGARWLRLLADAGVGALLADDMGLGKTVQVAAMIRPNERVLIVAPTSVIFGWQDQLAKFRPDLAVSLYHGPGRQIETAGIVLTSYGILRIDRELLNREVFDLVVLDESQTIKNVDSQVTRAAFALTARARVSLSGTPIENDLEDLWSQFRFLAPGYLEGRDAFQRRYSASNADLGVLHKKIKPFLLRRLKRDVASELPPRTEAALECELDADERQVYESILLAGQKEIADALGSGESLFSILEVLLRLRQACCDTRLVPGVSRASESSKLALLVESLERSVLQGHRSLVFSQWTSLLDRIEPLLQARGIRFSRLDGETRDRQGVVSEFQNSENAPDCMLLSLKAGGVGLTLTRAEHVYILDPWWNPAVEDQAADRSHRIGQEKPVMIYRIIARRTIEERILQLQSRKRELSSILLGAGGGASQLTREDLLFLIQE